MTPIGFIEPFASWLLIPEHCRKSLQDYILYGAPVGDFLSAVLSNDLRGAIARADDDNLPRLKDYITFLYQFAPAACWGSAKNHADWIKLGLKAYEQD